MPPFSAMQRSQPRAIASQVINALNMTTQRVQPQVFGSQVTNNFEETAKHVQVAKEVQAVAPVSTKTDRPGITLGPTKHLHDCWQLGFAQVTGLIRVFTSFEGRENSTNQARHIPVLRIQVQMPEWICVSMFDSVFYRSYSGWTHSLSVIRAHGSLSWEFSVFFQALKDDDPVQVQRLLQDRRIGPRDRVIWIACEGTNGNMTKVDSYLSDLCTVSSNDHIRAEKH